MEVLKKKEGVINFVELSGKVDANNSSDLEKELFQIINQNEKNLLVDCKNLEYISSSGLRVFLMALKQMNKNNGKLVLCGLNELIQEVFDISGFSSLFTIVSSGEEAVKIFT
jgi:anti-sigma B factor antagonist